MKTSTLPYKFQDAWADMATTDFILSPIPDTTGSAVRASQQLGFPPGNADPSGAPPSIKDMNGVLSYMSLWLQRVQAGQMVPLDLTFQGWIGGYPSGAIVASVASPGLQYMSTVDDNTTNPDSGSPGGSGWIYYAVLPTQVVVSASGNVTVPPGKYFAEVELWGGGGGGSGGNGASGAGGGYARKRIAVTPGATLAFVIGAGGTGAPEGSATDGGATSLTGASLTASGGTAGNAGSGPGGVGTGGDLNLAGGPGTDLDGSVTTAPGGACAGPGGGAGGTINSTNTSSLNPVRPGGGGAGSYNGGTSTSGQAGAAGLAIVTF